MRNNQLLPVRIIITRFNQEEDNFMNLYGVYKDAIAPDITYHQFMSLYVHKDLLKIDFTCFYDGMKRAGFSAAFFYAATINGKKSYIVKSATGLLEAYQGRGLHNKYELYSKFIRFALQHPGKPVWVCAFVINAFVYKNLCRFVPVIAPMPGKEIPLPNRKIIDYILASGTHQADENNPLSLEVPIQVRLNEALLKRIFASEDPNVQWYLKANPRFLDKYGLLVVIGVSARNICGTLWNMASYSATGKLSRWENAVKKGAKQVWRKTAILVANHTRRRIL